MGPYSFVGICRKTNSVIPANEIEDSADAEVWQFRYDQCHSESFPIIHLGLLLSCLKYISAFDE